MNLKTYRILINGALVEGHQLQTMESINPATEEVVGLAAWGSEEDAKAAVDAASAAFADWAATSPVERAGHVRELARRLRDNVDELSALETADLGNPISLTRRDVRAAAEELDYFAGLARELKGMTMPSTSGGWHFTVREPYGVVVRIIPFNHPILFAGSKIAAPLMAGNTVILKPPPQAPLSVLLMAELAVDLFPAGVLNVVAGEGPTVGNALVTDSRVRRIAFIGSVETGKAVVRQSADHLAEVTLELGGKNPLIMFPDVTVEQAAGAAVRAMNFAWQGQSCGSASRLFVHVSILDEVTKAVVDCVNAIRLGPPDDPETEMGPIVSRQHYERVMRYIELGQEEGAALLSGGKAPLGDAFTKGYWIAPTVFGDVKPGMRIAQEEIFGPVLSILSWDDEDEVIRQANQVQYGLTANIWTNDISAALRVVPRLEAGYCYVNGRTEHFLGLPFGGYKESGQGREESLDELVSYTQSKSVSVLPAR